MQAAIARDYRVDPTLYAACKGDAEKLCGDVKDGGGRILSCLRDKSNKGVSWECQEQLVVQEAEEDDDVRLSTRLFKKCLADKKRFCADVEPGHGAARDCLVEHREDTAFSKECREELVGSSDLEWIVAAGCSGAVNVTSVICLLGWHTCSLELQSAVEGIVCSSCTGLKTDAEWHCDP